MTQLGGKILGFPASEDSPLAEAIRVEFLFGQGAPGARLGKRGDLYLDANTRNFYKKTNAYAWVLMGVLSVRILTGSAEPDDADGSFGDFYFRDNGQVYSKSAIAWVLMADLTGPVGATGPAGVVSATSALVLQEVASTPSTPADELHIYNRLNQLRWRLQGDGTEHIAASLNRPQTYTAAQAVGTVVLSDATTINTDCSLSNTFRVVLGGNRTLADPTNLVDGGTYIWQIRQDATGGRSLSFGPAFIWLNGGTTPVLTSTPNATELVTCTSDGISLFCTFTGA